MKTDKIIVVSKGGKNYEIHVPPNRLKMLETLSREKGETLQKYVESLLDYAIETSLGPEGEDGSWAEGFDERAGNTTITKEEYDSLQDALRFAKKFGFKSAVFNKSGQTSGYEG